MVFLMPCLIDFSWLPAVAETVSQQKQDWEKRNQERKEGPRRSFLDVGTHLPQSDPWIRGQGWAAQSKLLHILNRLS